VGPVNTEDSSQRVKRLVDEEFKTKLHAINEEAVTNKIRETNDCLESKLQEGVRLDDAVQEKLGESIALLTEVALTDSLWLKNMQVVEAISVSIKALLADPPNIELAENIQKTCMNVFALVGPRTYGEASNEA
jgi:hypothetical protein